MERYLFIPTNIEDWHWTSCYVQVGPRIRDPKSVADNLAPRMQYGDSYGHRKEQESRKPKVRKTPSWPRSWANFSLF